MFISLAVLVTLASMAVSCSKSDLSSVPPLTSKNTGTVTTTSAVVPATSPATTPALQNSPSVAIMSVYGPIPPFNPGGPVIAITLKNVSDQPVVSLTATLELNRSFDFNYDVTSVKPLLANNIISAKITLINGGFSDNLLYPLKISGTFQNGSSFSYTDQVEITAPPAASSNNSP
jgi:hypothetical protein